ncbi:MAG: serine/threonine protein kinase, partial [Cyanobacteria bacterium RYN_339]|nr:serine/threonine protein kinase [Cyanobacteria bacterium RYN_339]
MTTAPPIGNRYEVLETLGEGAMGLVWRVRDSVANQEVALKIISQRYGASSPGEAPSAKSVLQFQQEFRLMTQLRHPNCCAVYEYGLVADGSPFFTMEVVEGRGLDQLKPVDGPTFVHVLSQVLLALGYIHQLGFVHCDLKSANVRVKPDGTVKLMDYGLMEYARRPSGFINGTIAYISPEVIRRGAIDQRTDLYSLGVLAYEMLTGRVPFDSTDARVVLAAHINEAPVPPTQLVQDIDPLHEHIVLKLLAKSPLDRYQSAYEALEALGVAVPAGIGGNLLTSPLMGRERELEVLTASLAQLKRGQGGQALLLSGPSGIGKSRLLEEFRFTVQLANTLNVVGQSFEQGNSPYGPFVAVLKALMPAVKQHIPDDLALYAPVLAQLLP